MQRFFANEKATDETYSFNCSCPERKDFRNYLEKLWFKYADFADKDFLSEARRQFHNRTWEMYLACTFLEQNIQILRQGENISGKKLRPDIKFKINKKIAWCEAIAVSRGEGDDAVPAMNYNIAQDLPEKEMILRLTSGVCDKYKKYKKYLDEEVIQKNEPFIIAINRHEVGFIDQMNCSMILKALFAKKCPLLSKCGNISCSKQLTITKKNGGLIKTIFFEDLSYSGISALIYENRHIIDLQGGPLGSNLIIVHNPLAKNPIPKKMLKVREEF